MCSNRSAKRRVLHMLVEGNSIRSTERLTGVHRDTICRLWCDSATACKRFMDQQLRDLALAHVEVDEIWTFVEKKQGRLDAGGEGRAVRHRRRVPLDRLDQNTKLVASFVVGKRSADNARKLMVDLAGRLVMPKPHASDPHGYQAGGYVHITQISHDGFPAYPEAVDLAFGPYAKYGQIIKDYRNADQPGRYAPPEMVGDRAEGDFRDERARGADNMHFARRTPQPDDPHPDEAVHPAVSGLLQEAGEPGGGCRHVPGLLQLLLANPLPRLQRQARQTSAAGRRNGWCG